MRKCYSFCYFCYGIRVDAVRVPRTAPIDYEDYSTYVNVSLGRARSILDLAGFTTEEAEYGEISADDFVARASRVPMSESFYTRLNEVIALCQRLGVGKTLRWS